MDGINNEFARPVMRQGSENPIFRGTSGTQLKCVCGYVLVDGYFPKQYSGIDLQCFNCKNKIQLDGWPSDEPLPDQLVNLEPGKIYLICGTVDFPDEVVIASHDETTQNSQRTKPRQNKLEFKLLPESLTKLREHFDSHTCGELEDSIRKTLNATRTGNKRFFDYPLSWAFIQLDRILNIDKTLKLDNHDDCAAIAYIQTLTYYINQWLHHPLFTNASAGCVREFHHTLNQLSIASFIADLGHPLGFTNTAIETGKSPDLYLIHHAQSKFSIEVKAPTYLQWPNPIPDKNTLERKILRVVKKAKEQFTSDQGGLVVIGVSAFDEKNKAKVDDAIASLIAAGKISDKVGGVVRHFLDLNIRLENLPEGSIAARFGGHSYMHKNHRYAGSVDFG